MQNLVLAAVIFGVLATSAQASVEISSNPTRNMNCTGGICTPTAKNADLNATDLANMLASGDVKVVTGAGAVTITVSQSFSWTSTHRLTLDANLNVSFRAPVEVAGRGGVTIVTNDGGTDGDLLFFPEGKLDFWDTSSSLVINGSSYLLVNDIQDLAIAIQFNPSGYFALASDYNATPDGTYAQSPIPTKFGGTFIGLNHGISGLSVGRNHPAAKPFYPSEYGLFSQTLSTSRLAYLKLIDANFNVPASHLSVGILVGINQGTILHASSSGFVLGGYAHNSGSSKSAHVGGLVGRNTSTGILFLSSSSAGVQTHGRYSSAGGLVGLNAGQISTCFATGMSATGGRAGREGEGGGLVGTNEGQIDHSYAMGDVSGDGISYLGGLIGETRSSKIDQAYSIGKASDGSYEGGFVGYDNGSSNLSSTYWDLDTSGISDPSRGAGNKANDPGITGLTDVQMKSGLPTGFDPNIWGLSASINNGYPYLLANPPPQ